MPYDTDIDPYIDNETAVMRNKLKITTLRELDVAEAEITYAQISSLMIEGHMDLTEVSTEALLEIHRVIFGDIYDWAGKFRSVELSKDTTRFAPVAFLQANTDALMQQLLRDQEIRTNNHEKFAVRFAHYYNELNVLHPFREGNGRAIRTFMAMLADDLGWFVAWNKMDPEENVQACVAGYHGDESLLQEMIGVIVERAHNNNTSG